MGLGIRGAGGSSPLGYWSVRSGAGCPARVGWARAGRWWAGGHGWHAARRPGFVAELLGGGARRVGGLDQGGEGPAGGLVLGVIGPCPLKRSRDLLARVLILRRGVESERDALIVPVRDSENGGVNVGPSVSSQTAHGALGRVAARPL